jgi:beta-1,2-mannobiose phosphorylase / 1,2-beta-oligomannan phosphorylase
MIKKFSNNPILRPEEVIPSRPDFEVLAVFNPGATIHAGDVLLLARVAERPLPKPGHVATAFLNLESGKIEPLYVPLDDPDLEMNDPRVFRYQERDYLTSISHFRVARSTEGRKFEIAEGPSYLPATAYEAFGVEDPRITQLGDWYYLTYSAVSPMGVLTALARTRDFLNFERMGNIFAPDNKDVAIFPEKIADRYYAFHRPSLKHLGQPSMWLASSRDLLDWGRHEFLIGPRPGKWDSQRVGCGAAPIRTQAGWLQLYHAADENIRYCTGAILLDLESPSQVLARSEEPFLVPDQNYECVGFMPNVVFHSGLTVNGSDELALYYGAADDKICGATVSISKVLASLREQ